VFNLFLMIIVFYYLLRTGDLFKLTRVVRKITLNLLFSLKKQRQKSKERENPTETLKLRYVKGEISQNEYEQISKNLL